VIHHHEVRTDVGNVGVQKPSAIAAPQLTDTSDTTLFWDGCHLFPKAYQIVADLVVQAIRSIPQ
jgi:hypothetical protein